MKQKHDGLAALAQIKKSLALQAEQAQAERVRLAALAKQEAAQRHLFQTAIGKVQPIVAKPQAPLQSPKPLPFPLQHACDEAAALQESLSDEVDISTLLDTDDTLSFRRPGVGADVAQNLRKGTWSIQRQIDLHGLRSDDARDALGQFIREAHQQGIRCVRVIHGKGLGSPGKIPVLKNKVYKWLVQKTEVVAFVQAQPAQGGAGALVVLLQPLKTPGPRPT